MRLVSLFLLCHVLTAAQYRIVGATMLPDASVTPGRTATTSETEVCAPGYSKRARGQVRKTTLKRAVAGYGLAWLPREYEADHRIPIELGGAVNDIRNLWPQPILAARQKDKVENRLHRMVCAGEISLKEAQARILRWGE